MKRGLQISLVVLVAAAILCAAQSGQSLFQKALSMERAQGDLAGAIRLYERVVKEFAKDRKLAAEALFRIGECHQALGDAEARKAFERLVREYGDQADLVKEAQSRLASMTVPETQPKFTRIRVPTKFPFFTALALSPDGQQVAYVGDGSVWLVPVHGPSDPNIAGPPRRITERIATEMTTTDIVWSQDGRWIALKIFQTLKDGTEESAIYLVPATGGPPRVVELEVKDRGEHYTDNALSLSPDASLLAYTTWKEGEDASKRSVFIAPTKGGHARVLTRQVSNQPSFSPDGKRIAYCGWIKGWEIDPDRFWPQQVWVTSVDGGDPTLVYQSPSSERIRGPIWSPDGKVLAFVAGTSAAGGCDEVVFVSIGADGRRTGSPDRMKLPEPTGEKLGGWGSDNAIAVVLSSPELEALYSVPAYGGKAVQLTPKDAMMPSWTPDGKRIYFDGCNLGDCGAIEYVPASGGKVTRIPVKSPHGYFAFYPTGSVSVSPDGKRILFAGGFVGRGTERIAHIFTVPADGGELTEIHTGMSWEYEPCWSPDGKSIAFVGGEETPNKDDMVYQIYAVPSGGGKPRQLTSLEDRVLDAKVAWSPDGKNIAYFSIANELRLVPLDGGQSRILLKDLKDALRWFGLAWSPDGSELAYGSGKRIWRLNLGTMKSEELQTGLDAIHCQFSWSPDGKTIAFVAQQGGEPDLCLMSDFLALLKPKR